MEIFIFIFPLLSFIVSPISFFYKHINLGCFLHSLFTLSSFFISLFLFLKLLHLDKDIPIFFYPLIKLNYYDVDWSLRLDFFVSSMICLITFISSIVIIYSIHFYKNNIIKLKKIGFLSLSTFGILVLVSSNNLIQFFLGWQIILISSYILVTFLNKKTFMKDNSRIFIYNRLSDLGVFFSIFILYSLTHSSNFEMLFNSNYFIKDNTFSLFGLNVKSSEFSIFLLFFSYLLRFRQFFISNSIYDIRNINIPALTLIFCSMYLPAGLYIIIRFLPLIHDAPNFLNIIIILGFILTLIFIFLSLIENNIKLLISYIASSQFSMIIFSIGFKAYHAAIFYLITTTLSITMIFLCIGMITIKLDDENDIRNMGGLFFKLPSTFLFIIIGILSILGIPFFAGFYSKELIVFSSNIANQTFLFLPLTLGFIVSLMISYILIKNVLLIFWCNNNCNIHYFNKINENSYLIKFICIVLGLSLVISGWFLNNFFYGSNANQFWYSLLNININLSVIHQNYLADLIKKSMIYVTFLGIFLALFNYTIVPILRNSYKLKYNKIFMFYIKQLLRIS